MLKASTFKFLKDLKKNNNKPWFEKHKDLYLGAKEDVEDFDFYVDFVLNQFQPLTFP